MCRARRQDGSAQTTLSQADHHPVHIAIHLATIETNPDHVDMDEAQRAELEHTIMDQEAILADEQAWEAANEHAEGPAYPPSTS